MMRDRERSSDPTAGRAAAWTFYVLSSILVLAGVIGIIAWGPVLWPAYSSGTDAVVVLAALVVLFWLGRRHARRWRASRKARRED